MGIKFKHVVSHLIAFLIGGIIFASVSFAVTSYFFGKYNARAGFHYQMDSWKENLRTIEKIKNGNSADAVLELEKRIYDIQALIESCPEYSCEELKILYAEQISELRKYEFTE